MSLSYVDSVPGSLGSMFDPAKGFSEGSQRGAPDANSPSTSGLLEGMLGKPLVWAFKEVAKKALVGYLPH